jgi:outer membrane protein OmpA-like peptidoglycan-associated protein
MTARIIKATAAAAGLAMITSACAAVTSGSGQIRMPAVPPSALVIVGTHLGGDHGAVTSLVAGSARPGERLELISPDFRSGNTLAPPVAPAAPAIRAPKHPGTLPADPTQYQIDTHKHQQQAYAGTIAADKRALRRVVAARMRSWSQGVGAAIARMTPRGATGWNVRTALTTAGGYFSSLQEAGVNLGARRVIVVFWPSGLNGAVIPLDPGSLPGGTVVIANFPAGERQQAEWQADLLQAGASRAVVLVPGAESELRSVVSRALRAYPVPVPTVVRFALNQASLQPTAIATLQGLVLELLRTYPNSSATVLGFADPIGTYTTNLRLSYRRAIAVRDFLVAHNVAASRLFAVGYGPALPVTADGQDGAQPLDRRVVVVIEPVA